MAGRPRLRIGERGRITRTDLGGGVWVARCRYRDTDGMTRKVERRSPEGQPDVYGKLAEDALVSALTQRRISGGGEITLDTKVIDLVNRHIDQLDEEGRAIRTIDTYRYVSSQLERLIAGVRVQDSKPGKVDSWLRSMNRAHGDTMAKQAKTLLRGAFRLAVLAESIELNPVRDLQPIRKKKTKKASDKSQKGAPALTADQLRHLLIQLEESAYCQKADLVDPAKVLMATGFRRGELLGLRWVDFDEQAAALTVEGKVVRKHGDGLVWEPFPKSDSGFRTVSIPQYIVGVLAARRSKPFLGQQKMIFPSTVGTWRDPDNFNGQWRKARESLGVPDVTSHSFRKSVATLIDEGGLSARVGADQLGHAKVSMTQDTYMARDRVHPEVSDMLGRTIFGE